MRQKDNMGRWEPYRWLGHFVGEAIYWTIDSCCFHVFWYILIYFDVRWNHWIMWEIGRDLQLWEVVAFNSISALTDVEVAAAMGKTLRWKLWKRSHGLLGWKLKPLIGRMTFMNMFFTSPKRFMFEITWESAYLKHSASIPCFFRMGTPSQTKFSRFKCYDVCSCWFVYVCSLGWHRWSPHWFWTSSFKVQGWSAGHPYVASSGGRFTCNWDCHKTGTSKIKSTKRWRFKL